MRGYWLHTGVFVGLLMYDYEKEYQMGHYLGSNNIMLYPLYLDYGVYRTGYCI